MTIFPKHAPGCKLRFKMMAHNPRPFPFSKHPLRRRVGRILVTPLAGARTLGKLVLPGLVIPCVLGRSGITHHKREGDGATPAGHFRILGLWARVDRMPMVHVALPRRTIRFGDGWCDDPASPAYNRPVRLPNSSSHERLWRDDGLYDVLLTLDYNLRYPRKGRGSAIFFHLARDDRAPTAGCVAIGRDAMRRLSPRLGPHSLMVIRR